MTPEQRYLFDVTGYLHLENALSDEELRRAQEAVKRYVSTPPEQLPHDFGCRELEPGFYGYDNGFAFDEALEILTRHPVTLPIICDLTHDKPRFGSGTLLIDRQNEGTHLHCAREDWEGPGTRYTIEDGRIFCDNLVVFPYLTDVFPGDGGLIVVPGSHKSQFERPRDLFYGGNKITADIPPGVVNLTPRAGDFVIISELLTHGTLPWKPAERDRCTLALRYYPQHYGIDVVDLSEETRASLSPETLELMAITHITNTKEIVKAIRSPA